MTTGKKTGNKRLQLQKSASASLVTTANAAEAAFEERLRRKLDGESQAERRTYKPRAQEKKGRDKNTCAPPTPEATRTLAEAEFEERLRRKLESEDRARRKACSPSRSHGCDPNVSRGEKGTNQNKKDQGSAPWDGPSAESIEAGSDVCLESVLDMAADLQRFKEENGHLNIPLSHTIFTNMMDEFSSLGMEQMLDRRWDHQYADLEAFEREHDDCLVPVTHPTLGRWMRTQCTPFKLFRRRVSSSLTKRRYQKLSSVGFDKFIEWEESNKESTHPGRTADAFRDDELDSVATEESNLEKDGGESENLWMQSLCVFQSTIARFLDEETVRRVIVGFDKFMEWEATNKQNIHLKRADPSPRSSGGERCAHSKKLDETSRDDYLEPIGMHSKEEVEIGQEATRLEMHVESEHLWRRLGHAPSDKSLTSSLMEDEIFDGADGAQLVEKGDAAPRGEGALDAAQQNLTRDANIRRKKHATSRDATRDKSSAPTRARAEEKTRPDKKAIRAEMQEKSKRLRRKAPRRQVLTNAVVECESSDSTDEGETQTSLKHSVLMRSQSWTNQCAGPWEGDTLHRNAQRRESKDDINVVLRSCEGVNSNRKVPWRESNANIISWSDLNEVLESAVQESCRHTNSRVNSDPLDYASVGYKLERAAEETQDNDSSGVDSKGVASTTELTQVKKTKSLKTNKFKSAVHLFRTTGKSSSC